MCTEEAYNRLYGHNTIYKTNVTLYHVLDTSYCYIESVDHSVLNIKNSFLKYDTKIVQIVISIIAKKCRCQNRSLRYTFFL